MNDLYSQTAQYRELDIKHLWHPYTDPAEVETKPYALIERAEGSKLYTSDGRMIYDAIASWWCTALGHGHPRLVAAIQRQAADLQHVLLGGVSNKRAVELAARLAAIAPKGLQHTMFAADGASAVECALKIAVQYWFNRGERRRTRFVCHENAYHGDTLGAVGVGYVPGFHDCFDHNIIHGLRAQSPWNTATDVTEGLGACAPGSLESMEKILDQHGEEVAAVIVEPLIQGAAGARIYPAAYLRWLRELCDRHGVLLIADEIAVGLGRTGRMWAFDHADCAPDILCIGKALTGGYLPMSATMVTDEIYQEFKGRPGQDRMLYHGHTFTGNPITSALALETLTIFEEERIPESCRPCIEALAHGLESLRALSGIGSVKTLGMVGTLTITPETGGAARATRIGERAFELGLLIRPLADAIYLWPPLTSTPEEMAEMIRLLGEAIELEP